MANPLRLYFWMLGQDARLGYLAEWGFEPLQNGVYRRGSVNLHQLGLSLDSGLLYLRPEGRFFRGPAGTLPPECPAGASLVTHSQGWSELWPHLQAYEQWLERRRPGYRQQLVGCCPRYLRPLRRVFWQRFQPLLKRQLWTDSRPFQQATRLMERSIGFRQQDF